MSRRKNQPGDETATMRRKTRAANSLTATIDKPLRVTAVAAAVVAQTAREQKLTAEEEEQLKTRLQYRLYQRNHRAKKQRRMQELQDEVSTIKDQVLQLQNQRIQSQNHSAHETVVAFAAAVSSSQVSSSFSYETQPQQPQDRLYDLIDNYTPLETAVRQWVGLCEGFHDWKLEVEDVFDTVDAISEEDVSIVSCGLILTLTGSVDHFRRILPALHDARLHHLATRLASQQYLSVPGRGVFVVASNGRIHAVSMDFDFVPTIVYALEEPLAVVEAVLVGNRLDGINLNENQARPRVCSNDRRTELTQQRENSGQRLSMEFLLQ